jgi:hypothetical protein
MEWLVSFITWLLNFLGNKQQGPRDPSFAEMVRAKDPWDLNFPLFQWSQFDVHTLGQSFAHVGIFGELGCGKSTGSFATFLQKYFEIGMGGLICCVKPGDRELVESYARITGRSASLIVVSPENHWRCNLMRYALKRPTGISGSRVELIVSLLTTIVESAERGETGGGANDKFWDRSLRQLLRNAVELCIAARNDVTMEMLHEVIMSAPTTPAMLHDRNWQQSSLCYQLVEEADGRQKTSREQADFELAAKGLLRLYPELPSDTRGSVLATYSVMADMLLRGQMADLFNGETNFVPDVTLGGALICLDLPTKVYGQAGLTVQAAFSHIWQLMAEQRDLKANPRPLLYAADEYQELVTSLSYRFFSTSRSARIACLVASQNKPNYVSALGGGERGRSDTDALLASLGTKIFHANGDIETNRFASETINDAVQTRMNFHANRDGNGGGSGGGGESVGRKVLPSEFTQLKKGGAQNGFLTEAIVYQTGASFAANDGEPFLRTAFRQIIPGVTVRDSAKR